MKYILTLTVLLLTYNTIQSNYYFEYQQQSMEISLIQQLKREYRQTGQYKMKLINFDPDLSQMQVKHLATRNLNPGNLRSFITGRFRKFNNLRQGYLALIADIKWKQSGNSSVIDSSASLWEYIHVYAPTFENNSSQYAHDVANALDTDLNTPITQINPHNLAKWIIRTEDRQLFELMYEDDAFIKNQKIKIKKSIKTIVYKQVNLKQSFIKQNNLMMINNVNVDNLLITLNQTIKHET